MLNELKKYTTEDVEVLTGSDLLRDGERVGINHAGYWYITKDDDGVGLYGTDTLGLSYSSFT